MRTFHLKRHLAHCPTINVDRLWSLLPEGEYEKAKAGSEQTPVLDVTKLVSLFAQFTVHVKEQSNNVIAVFSRATSRFLARVSFLPFLSSSRPDTSARMPKRRLDLLVVLPFSLLKR